MPKSTIARVSEAFARYPIPLFIMFGENVCTKSTGNTNFPSFFPTIPTMQASLDDLGTKYQAALGRDHAAIVARDLSHERHWVSSARERPMCRLIARITWISCSAQAISRRSHPRRAGQLNAPANPKLRRTGLDGQIEYRFSRVPGVTGGYTIEVAEEPEGPFTIFAQVPKTTVIIDGRTAMKTYWVRSRAIGTAGPSPWSTVISIVAM